MKRDYASIVKWHFACLIALALLHGCVDTVKGDDQSFLEKVRTTADTTTQTSETGNLPGTTENPDEVPVIEVETEFMDLGVIPTNEMSHDELTVKNVGKAELVVSDVKTSCGCTQGKIVDNTIPPGGETVINVAVDPNRIYGFESTKTLTIFSNDPKQGAVQVKVHATIEPEFVLEPEQLDFDVLDKGTPASQTAVLRQMADTPVPLVDVQVQGQVADWLDVSFEERPADQWKDPEKREYDVNVAVKPEAPAGPLAAQVLLKLDLPRVKKFYLPVRANITAFYSIAPPAGSFGPAQPGDTIENVLRIASSKPFTVVSATADKPYITLTPHAEGSGNTQAIDVTIGQDAPKGTYVGKADIVLQGEGQKFTEKIRLTGVVQSSGPSQAVAPASTEVKPVAAAPLPSKVGKAE